MPIDLNLSGAVRPKFEALPEGEYTLVLDELVIKPGAKNANIHVAHCTYKVVDHENDAYNDRKIKYWQVIDPEPGEHYELQRGFLKIWVEALLGEPIGEDISLDEDDLVGRHVRAFIKQDVQEKGTYAQIANFILPFDDYDASGDPV